MKQHEPFLAWFVRTLAIFIQSGLSEAPPGTAESPFGNVWVPGFPPPEDPLQGAGHEQQGAEPQASEGSDSASMQSAGSVQLLDFGGVSDESDDAFATFAPDSGTRDAFDGMQRSAPGVLAAASDPFVFDIPMDEDGGGAGSDADEEQAEEEQDAEEEEDDLGSFLI
eukprot:jgi/Ulvmu1/5520/UM023_0056.1